MGLNTTPRTWVTGEVVTAAELNTEVRDALIGIQAAWTAWTPTFTNLSLGNGTVTARYLQIGKTLLMRGAILGGTTTTSSGTISMPLPLGTLVNDVPQIVPGITSSPSAQLAVWSFAAGATAGSLLNATLGAVTIGSGGYFRWSGSVEIA